MHITLHTCDMPPPHWPCTSGRSLHRSGRAEPFHLILRKREHARRRHFGGLACNCPHQVAADMINASVDWLRSAWLLRLFLFGLAPLDPRPCCPPDLGRGWLRPRDCNLPLHNFGPRVVLDALLELL
eukprot:5450982-Prymnesium_polylepis.1